MRSIATRLEQQTLEPSDHFYKMAPLGVSITSYMFNFFLTGTDWKDVANHFDVLHKHGCSSVSEGLQKGMFNPEERRTTEAGTSETREKQRENRQCAIPGIYFTSRAFHLPDVSFHT